MGSAPSAFPPGISYKEAKKICNGDDLFKIVELATYSAATEDFVKKRGIRHVTGVEAKFESGGVNKVIVIYRGQSYSFKLLETADSDDYGRISVQAPLQCVFRTKKSKSVVGKVSKRFMDIFHEFTLANVDFNDPDRDIRDLANFDHIFLTKQFSISKPKVSSEELSFVAGKFFQSDRIHFHTTPPKEYTSWPLKYHNMQIINEVPLTGEQLSRMSCVKLEIVNSELTTTEMNKFFKHWRENDTLMDVERVIFRNFDNRRDLFSGLKNQMWHQKNRGQYYLLNPTTKFDASKSVDITREDGTLASITFEPERSFCMFLVWRERFPDIDGLSISDY